MRPGQEIDGATMRPGDAASMAHDADQRLIALDGLRGIAALVVVVFHFTMGFGAFSAPGFFSATPLHLLWDGSAAVSVFFVLSGFVLSYGYLQQGGARPLQVRTFYISRALRLLGPYAVAFLLSACCVLYLFSYPTAGREWRGLPFLATWIQAAAMSPAEWLREGLLLEPDLRYRAMVQAWSLSVEFYLSLLFPLLILLLRRSEPLFVAVLLLIPVYYRLPVFHPYPLLASGVVHFMLGMMLAGYHGRLEGLALLRSPVCRWLLFAIGAVCLSVRHTINTPLQVFNPFGYEMWDVAGFGAFVIVCAALVSRPFKRLLSLPLIQWLGSISYSLYLVHIMVLYLWVPKAMQAASALGAGREVVWLAGLTAALGLSLALAQVFFWCVERPCTRFARKVANRRQHAPAAVGGAAR